MVKALIAFRIVSGLGCRCIRGPAGLSVKRGETGRAPITRTLLRHLSTHGRSCKRKSRAHPDRRADVSISLDNLRCGAVILANSGVYLLAARPVLELPTDRRLNF